MVFDVEAFEHRPLRSDRNLLDGAARRREIADRLTDEPGWRRPLELVVLDCEPFRLGYVPHRGELLRARKLVHVGLGLDEAVEAFRLFAQEEIADVLPLPRLLDEPVDVLRFFR